MSTSSVISPPIKDERSNEKIPHIEINANFTVCLPLEITSDYKKYSTIGYFLFLVINII